jgi:hypothetical protein
MVKQVMMHNLCSEWIIEIGNKGKAKVKWMEYEYLII